VLSIDLPEPTGSDVSPSLVLEIPSFLDMVIEAPELSEQDLPTLMPVSAELQLAVTAEALEDLLVTPQELEAGGSATADHSSTDLDISFDIEDTVDDAVSVEELPVAPVQPTLYDIFLEEARGHLQVLVDSYAALDIEPSAPTSFDMTRAAHTLGGIAATVGLMPLNRLAIGLEHALLRRDGSDRPESIEGLETVRQAIVTLESMFAGLSDQLAPADQPQLLLALDDIFLAMTPPSVPEAEEAAAPDVSGDAIEAGLISEKSAAVATQALPLLTDELDDQLLPIFLEEAADQLREMAAELRIWRAEPGNLAPVQVISRVLHTFKGNARMAGAMNLGEVTHQLETRLEAGVRVGSDLALIDEIEAGYDLLAQSVEYLRDGPPPAPVVDVAAGDISIEAGELKPVEAVAEQDVDSGEQRATLRVRADLVDLLANEAGELSIARARIEGEMRSLKGSLLDLTENVIRLRRQLREIEIQAETQMQARVAHTPEGDAEFDPLELDRFTRFHELTRFMAESVNDVATVQQNLLKNLDDANAAILAQSRLNRSLQQNLMSVRMVPFASQPERLYRIVRQTAKEVGKRANLDILGGQVEIDRTVLDKMLGPIEHMLRNSVTHGIEPREQRLAAGKSEVGEISMALTQEGNEIILSITDDGKGLDAERIRARAEVMGLLQPGKMPDEATLFDFIFQPGFSTATELTQLAGRGIGMDVVKTAVVELGGRIEILSTPGKGTTFRLYLPLTLAVTKTLLTRVGARLYAVPSTMIEQVQELKENALSAIREKGEVVWQGVRYPFHYLPHLLGDTTAVPEARRRYWVLLLRSGSQRVAVQVDELNGNQEVVVKNIGAQLARVIGISGATVLGDGQVVLILNPVALASRTAVVSVKMAAPVAKAVVRVPTVLVVDDSLTVRKITSRLLTREGFQVVLAKDGVDALEQLQDFLPDVVLSDIEMPRMDGFDLVRNMRADPRLKPLPVIMITSRTADKHRNYAFEIGANHYLGKPYDEEELVGLIAGYVAAKATE
jgi:chemosensory pili system protein ChpA (sensor histidine kinase/response regulator)